MTDALVALVEAYAAFGHHRTGTAAGDATIDWFASELEARGANVERHPFTFTRYDARWEVTADGDVLPSFPLFYEATGGFREPSAAVAGAGARAVLADPRAHEPAVELARTQGASIAVLATGDRLRVPNRPPVEPRDIPVLLTSDAVLGARRVGAWCEAWLADGRSENVVGRFGDGDRPLVVATPLTGWFACAGERGTGIAVALAVAPTLAAHRPVVVVGTSGHELVDLGLERLLGRWAPDAHAVLHIGASVAAAEPPGRGFAASRLSFVSVPGAAGDDVHAALRAMELDPIVVEPGEARDPARWLGEAKGWSALGVPLVSVTGATSLFHTPDDLPDASTTPELLATAAAAFERVGAALAS